MDVLKRDSTPARMEGAAHVESRRHPHYCVWPKIVRALTEVVSAIFLDAAEEWSRLGTDSHFQCSEIAVCAGAQW